MSPWRPTATLWCPANGLSAGAPPFRAFASTTASAAGSSGSSELTSRSASATPEACGSAQTAISTVSREMRSCPSISRRETSPERSSTVPTSSGRRRILRLIVSRDAIDMACSTPRRFVAVSPRSKSQKRLFSGAPKGPFSALIPPLTQAETSVKPDKTFGVFECRRRGNAMGTVHRGSARQPSTSGSRGFNRRQFLAASAGVAALSAFEWTPLFRVPAASAQSTLHRHRTFPRPSRSTNRPSKTGQVRSRSRTPGRVHQPRRRTSSHWRIGHSQWDTKSERGGRCTTGRRWSSQWIRMVPISFLPIPPSSSQRSPLTPPVHLPRSQPRPESRWTYSCRIWRTPASD